MNKVVSIDTPLTREQMQGEFNEISFIQGEIRELIKQLGDICLLKGEYVGEFIADRITEEEYNRLIAEVDIRQKTVETQLKHAKEKVNDLTGLMNLKRGTNFKDL